MAYYMPPLWGWSTIGCRQYDAPSTSPKGHLGRGAPDNPASADPEDEPAVEEGHSRRCSKRAFKAFKKRLQLTRTGCRLAASSRSPLEQGGVEYSGDFAAESVSAGGVGCAGAAGEAEEYGRRDVWIDGGVLRSAKSLVSGGSQKWRCRGLTAVLPNRR